jgi:tetratricopeptide (TPR) repeat protein
VWLASVRVVNVATGAVVWVATGRADLAALEVQGAALRLLGDEDNAIILVTGNDPRLVLPVLDSGAPALLAIEAWVKVSREQQVAHESAYLGIVKRSAELLPQSLSRKQANTLDLAAYLNKTGESLYIERKYKLAAEYFYRALNMAPNSAWYCQNLAEAVARLDFKKDEPWEGQHLADRITTTGKWDVVVRYYRRALKLDAEAVVKHKEQQRYQTEKMTEQAITNPVFIVGCGHSGTSLMLAMLGNHPRFHPIPKESALFLRTDATINRTFAQWDQDCANQGKARWVEKTPPHIFQILRFLAFRPHSRFLLMLRDGRDVICSLKVRQGYKQLQDRIDRWIYDNLAGQPYWQHPQVKVVKYEDLVADPENELRTVCQFLGEDYSPALLDYHKTEHRWYSDKIVKPEVIKTHQDHNDNRNWQINQPIFDGRGRWRAELTEKEKQWIKQSLAQKLLEKFGYVHDDQW